MPTSAGPDDHKCERCGALMTADNPSRMCGDCQPVAPTIEWHRLLLLCVIRGVAKIEPGVLRIARTRWAVAEDSAGVPVEMPALRKHLENALEADSRS